MERAVRVVIFEAGRRPRGTMPRREIRMCWAILSLAHQRLEASISCGVEIIDSTGAGVGARSGLEGSTKAEGSRIWPIKLLARRRELKPSSQAKKSCFVVRM